MCEINTQDNFMTKVSNGVNVESSLNFQQNNRGSDSEIYFCTGLSRIAGGDITRIAFKYP